MFVVGKVVAEDELCVVITDDDNHWDIIKRSTGTLPKWDESMGPGGPCAQR
jgi:hypothetical protein